MFNFMLLFQSILLGKVVKFNTNNQVLLFSLLDIISLYDKFEF